MAYDIKRTTELFICGKLALVEPAHTFVPFTGGSTTTDAAPIEPPFTVVVIKEATRTHATESTWFCTGNVQVITHARDSTSSEHSLLVRRIYAALGSIDPAPSLSGFTFHGLDISSHRSAQDDESEAYADIFEFTCGVGG